MIKVNQLSKFFGDFQAVKDISFEIDKGEVLGFLGPNGAGKSTTMKMITGFLAASSGESEICGYNVAQSPKKAKACMGYLPEGAPSYGDMTPLEFLGFVANMRGLKGQAASDAISRVIDKIELGKVRNQPIHTLSKGFKRRVGLAQAILHDPQVLILDEPTDGLDPNQKQQVRTLIQEMASEKAIVVSTHILEEVDAVCSRAMIINNGSVVLDGAPKELEAMSRFHQAVRMIINDPECFAKAAEALKSVEGVAEVEATREPGEIFVFPDKEEAIFQRVSQIATSNNWPVDGLYLEKGRLDDVFRQITAESLSC